MGSDIKTGWQKRTVGGMNFTKTIMLGVCGGGPSEVVGVSRGWVKGGAFDTFQ